MESANRKKAGIISKYGYSVLTIFIAIISILITYKRLYFGIDFFDESFYVASPYYFALGGRPFIDELNFVMQIPSLILYPFIKLYLYLVKSTDGIIFYMRNVYLFFNMIIALMVFLLMKKKISWQSALLSSLILTAFIPFGIVGLSYNTLGSGFFLLGCFLGFWIVSDNKKPKQMICAGLLHGLAAAAYPILLLMIYIYGMLIILAGNKEKKNILYYLSGATLILITVLPILINAGLSNLKISFDYVASLGLQGGGTEKALMVMNDFFVNYLNKYWLMIILAGIFAGIRSKLKVSFYLLLFFPLIYLFTSVSLDDKHAGMKYILYYGLIAPYFYLLIKDKKIAKQLLNFVWIPSFVTGMFISWTSGNGYLNGAFGFLPACIVTTTFITLLYLENISVDKPDSLSHKMHIIPSVLVLALFLSFQYLVVYRDDKIPELTATVSAGPYKGLRTSYEKNKYTETLYNDLHDLDKNNKSILFSYNFPAGYLFTSMKPATSNLWLFSKNQFPGIDKDLITKYYQRSNTSPDIVVRMKRFPITKSEDSYIIYGENDPIDSLIREYSYKEVLSKEDYTIYQKNTVK